MRRFSTCFCERGRERHIHLTSLPPSPVCVSDVWFSFLLHDKRYLNDYCSSSLFLPSFLTSFLRSSFVSSPPLFIFNFTFYPSAPLGCLLLSASTCNTYQAGRAPLEPQNCRQLQLWGLGWALNMANTRPIYPYPIPCEAVM